MEIAKPLQFPCEAITTQGRYVWAVARVKGGEDYWYNGHTYFIPLSGVVCTHEAGSDSLNDGFIMDESELMMISPEHGLSVYPADFYVVRRYTQAPT